jgi:hypothetical protein
VIDRRSAFCANSYLAESMLSLLDRAELGRMYPIGKDDSAFLRSLSGKIRISIILRQPQIPIFVDVGA